MPKGGAYGYSSGYSGGDMLRMTRDAERRVREMRERARSIVQDENADLPPPPQQQNQGWSTEPGRRRDFHRSQQAPPAEPPPPGQHPPPGTAPEPPPESPPGPPPQDREHGAKRPSGGGTTMIQDIVGSIGVGEDTLLILGLILILINQKADTTLILALAYLLI